MAVKEDVGMLIKMKSKCVPSIIKLELGYKIDETEILDLIEFVNARHDCADFRLLCLIKTAYSYNHLLSTDTQKALKDCILSFKYWMDEPGSDGMCYWSENHQLLFATCEYLAGLLYPDEIFTNNQKNGLWHVKRGLEKINWWLKDKFLYGFIEWHSNTYYEEDIAPLAMLIDFAKELDVITRSKIVMDLLFLDMALHSFEGYFVATSGRCYEAQKKDPLLADVNDILMHAFHILNHEADYSRLSSLFLLCKNYQVPEVILKIARCKKPLVIKDSMGLNLNEVKNEISKHNFDRLGMVLWQMEAFTNPESIEMTMDLFNSWKLYDNNFLADLKMINIKFLRKARLLPFLVKLLNPATAGVAIQRANTYTYKTEHFMLSSVINHHPKTFGDQQHIWQATLPDLITIFSTHPGSPMFDDPARNFSPSFWVGNGIMPDAYQDHRCLFLIYDLTKRKGFMERKRQKFVHFYLPLHKMTEVVKKEHVIYARYKETYIAILSNNNHEIRNEEEVQYLGLHHQFVIVLGSKDLDKNFANFVEMVNPSLFKPKKHKIDFHLHKNYQVIFNKGLWINHILQSKDFERLETSFAHVKRKPENYQIHYEKNSLILDFEKLIRKENNV